ncbi:MAG TPA: surface-adhesin E family protein [Pyrinomonadaceae bacterium]|jgi:hypothetical protein|nr:surface-adhesin E family protein [Pyrinomonadaceae bacterium]
MKTLIIGFAVILLQTPIFSQTLPEWFRVHTFDDKSIVELNTDYVMFSTDKTGRVRFRWTYVEPQNLGGKEQIKYQSLISEYRFDCQEKRFQIYTNQYLDAQGKLIHSASYDPSNEWRSARSGTIIKKLIEPACKLIDLRKREPALER